MSNLKLYKNIYIHSILIYNSLCNIYCPFNTFCSVESTGNRVVLLDPLGLKKCREVLMNPFLEVQRI